MSEFPTRKYHAHLVGITVPDNIELCEKGRFSVLIFPTYTFLTFRLYFKEEMCERNAQCDSPVQVMGAKTFVKYGRLMLEIVKREHSKRKASN